MNIDPVSAVANAVSDVALMITKTLPSSERQLLAFKLRQPKAYASIRQHILIQGYRYLKHHKNVSIDAYVQFIDGDLPIDEQRALKSILLEDFKK